MSPQELAAMLNAAAKKKPAAARAALAYAPKVVDVGLPQEAFDSGAVQDSSATPTSDARRQALMALEMGNQAPLPAPPLSATSEATSTPVAPPQPPPDERVAAEASDKDAEYRRLFETATRQLIAGLTRTPTAETVSQPGKAVSELDARKKALLQLEGIKANTAKDRAEAAKSWVEAESLPSKYAQAAQDKALAQKHWDMTYAASLDNNAASRENAAATRSISERQLGLHAQSVQLAEKGQEYSQTAGIPAGYHIAAGAKPDEVQRRDAATVIAARESALPIIAQIEALSKDPEAMLPNGKKRAQLKQQVQMLANSIRVTEGLGVPSGPDTQITKDIQGDPEAFVSLLTQRGPTSMAGVRTYFADKVGAKLKTYGIEPNGATAPASAAPKRVVNPATGEVLELRGGQWVKAP